MPAALRPTVPARPAQPDRAVLPQAHLAAWPTPEFRCWCCSSALRPCSRVASSAGSAPPPDAFPPSSHGGRPISDRPLQASSGGLSRTAAAGGWGGLVLDSGGAGRGRPLGPAGGPAALGRPPGHL